VNDVAEELAIAERRVYGPLRSDNSPAIQVDGRRDYHKKPPRDGDTDG
jgi:hypothetical protein